MSYLKLLEINQRRFCKTYGIRDREYIEVDMEFTQQFMISSESGPFYADFDFKEYAMYTIEVNPFRKTVLLRDNYIL